MAYDFLDIASTASVCAAQDANGVGEYWANFRGGRPSDRFTPAEAAFIAERDSLYVATVSESGWPYVQHRGGPPGFIRILDEKTLAIPDFRGNRQYISTGNLAANDRAALILMDYPHRRRLKIYAHIEARDLDERSVPTVICSLRAASDATREAADTMHCWTLSWEKPPSRSDRLLASAAARVANRRAGVHHRADAHHAAVPVSYTHLRAHET